jgi:adenylate cyclase
MERLRLWVFGHVRLGRQGIALAEEAGDPALYLVVAGSAYAMFVTGALREGVTVFDRAIELADGDPTLGAGISVRCPLAFCVIFKGGLVATMGKLDEARALIEQGMDMARGQADFEVVGWGHMWGTWLAFATGDPEAAHAHAQQSLEIAERIGDAFSRAYAWYWLGLAETMRGRYAQGRDAVERSRTMAGESRTAVEGESTRLGVLADAYRGLGDPERAQQLAREGIDRARAAGAVFGEIVAIRQLARAILASPGEPRYEEVAQALERGLELVRESEALAFEPLLRVELAELARRRGDEETRERELREAQRLFTEMGANGEATRLAGELAPLSS